MRLRAHHIYCVPFLMVNFAERGQGFVQLGNKLKQTLREGSDEPVEVVLGIDELCEVCSLRRGDCCQSPTGDEEEVRKLDSIVLKELGVSAGTVLTADEWCALIKQKSPLGFCSRCRLKLFCGIGSGKVV